MMEAIEFQIYNTKFISHTNFLIESLILVTTS